MNLRIAKKIIKAVGTPDASRYSDFQIGKAHARYQKTASYKQTEAFWDDLMASIRRPLPPEPKEFNPNTDTMCPACGRERRLVGPNWMTGANRVVVVCDHCMYKRLPFPSGPMLKADQFQPSFGWRFHFDH